VSRAKLEQLGYQVHPTDADPKVFSVAGFGLLTYVRVDDADTWAALANTDAHAYRKWFAENPGADELDVAERSLAVSEKLGTVTAAEAAAVRARITAARDKRPKRKRSK
jgi:hypothetical protein